MQTPAANFQQPLPFVVLQNNGRRVSQMFMPPSSLASCSTNPPPSSYEHPRAETSQAVGQEISPDSHTTLPQDGNIHSRDRECTAPQRYSAQEHHVMNYGGIGSYYGQPAFMSQSAYPNVYSAPQYGYSMPYGGYSGSFPSYPHVLPGSEYMTYGSYACASPAYPYGGGLSQHTGYYGSHYSNQEVRMSSHWMPQGSFSELLQDTNWERQELPFPSSAPESYLPLTPSANAWVPDQSPNYYS
ncbi:uncharacterized protein [Hyperolius riggenbachi]